MATNTKLETSCAMKPPLVHKSTVSSKPSIPVRQTLTSKLRSDRGNQLVYLKNNLEKLKENLKLQSVDTFKTPDAFKLKKEINKKPSDSTPCNSRLHKNEATNTKVTTILKTSIKLPARNIRTNIPETTPTNFIKTVPILNSKLYSAPGTARKVTFQEKKTTNSTLNVTSCFKNMIKTPTARNTANAIKTDPKRVITQIQNTNKSSVAIMLNSKKNKINEPILSAAKLIPKSNLKSTNTNKGNKKSVKLQSPLRKSLSAMHLKKVSNRNPDLAMIRSQSTVHMPDINNSNQFPSFNADTGLITFRSPSMAKRRSVAFQTPIHSTSNMMSPWSGCWSPSANDLKRRLSNWMHRRNKPLDSFHHLRCFGIKCLPNEEFHEENKENVEVNIKEKDSSYEDLHILATGNDLQSKYNKDNDIVVANEALYDLHKLILEGYPRDQCEAWLDVIRTKCIEIEEKPQYWECTAALEEVRGDFSNAVDCYKNALIKGAEVANVDDCLENLLEKFNILNISPNKNVNTPTANEMKKKLDARNIFKSSIINFAVTERAKKNRNDASSETEIKFTATPVRRSTRLFRSQQSSSSKYKICSTLAELESSECSNYKFCINKALKKEKY